MTRRIRAIPELAQVPIVAVTSHALSGDAAKTREPFANGYIAKFFSPRQLFARVRLGPGHPRQIIVKEASYYVNFDPAISAAQEVGMRARRSELLRSMLVNVVIRPTPGITLANRSLNPPEAQCASGSLPDWIASGVAPTGTAQRAALWLSRKHER